MTPILIYHTIYPEASNTLALTLGKNYEITCAFQEEGIYAYQVIDDDNMVQTLTNDGDWFSEHFEVVGDVSSVEEEI